MTHISKSLKCTEVRDLLTRSLMEKKSSKNKTVLNEHIQQCNDCRQFADNLEQINQYMSVQPDTKPDQELLETLLKKMRSQQSFSDNFFQRMITRIADLLQYRVPVYHFGLVTAIVGFAFWINQASMPHRPGPIEFSHDNMDTTQVVSNWRFIEKQAAGSCISADTILIRILRSTL